MSVSLTHFAESILVAMINENPAKFSRRVGLSLLSGVSGAIGGGPAFCEAELARYAGRGFDGAARVDVIVALSDGRAVPFELKLGTTRLTKSRIDAEWLSECQPSHADSRWSGNMMAILERKFCGVTDPCELVATVEQPAASGARTFELTREWFVVARRSVVSRWKRTPPAFSSNARLLAFEDIVDDFGGKDAFNTLVRSQLDIDFYDAWLATDDDAD
ncbi:MAG TPA: hypothetical protein VJN18_05235 [Polyangiaceae bacterium]|nr:hypothetical protein [Polyangiaceae bacterium]